MQPAACAKNLEKAVRTHHFACQLICFGAKESISAAGLLWSLMQCFTTSHLCQKSRKSPASRSLCGPIHVFWCKSINIWCAPPLVIDAMLCEQPQVQKVRRSPAALLLFVPIELFWCKRINTWRTPPSVIDAMLCDQQPVQQLFENLCGPITLRSHSLDLVQTHPYQVHTTLGH